MRTHSFYPLADSPEFGLLETWGEKPVPARFLTPEQAKHIARRQARQAEKAA